MLHVSMPRTPRVPVRQKVRHDAVFTHERATSRPDVALSYSTREFLKTALVEQKEVPGRERSSCSQNHLFFFSVVTPISLYADVGLCMASSAERNDHFFASMAGPRVRHLLSYYSHRAGYQATGGSIKRA